MIELENDTSEDYATAPSVRTRGRSFCHECLRVFSFCTNRQIERHLFEDSQSPLPPAVRQPHVMKTGQRWILVLFALTSVIVVVTLLVSSVSYKHGSLTITLDLDELTERGKCPACFGVKLCPQMIQGKIELNDWTKYSVSKLVNSKNVFYATWHNRGVERKLILKKLAHDNELARLDKELCNRHGKQDQCDSKDAVRLLIDKYSYTHKNRPDDPILHGEKIGKVTDALLCPSHHKMDYIIERVTKLSKGPHRNTILMHILTMLLVNPEPLILQTFRAEDGWPFPVYYGACGRIVAEEYVGNRLTTFYKYDFHIRATIALELLEIAFKLSDNDTDFILYLADISPDNFAVNEDDYKVKVIDLENIIIVDKTQLDKTGNNKVHVSESMNCQNKQSGNSEGQCFSVSTEELCVYPVTDHNFYAICAGLLASDPLSQEFPEGLLHNPPSELSNSKFNEYLESCRVPGPKYNRIEAAQKLRELLENYVGVRGSR
ncbi:unnamed protein product [Allacma fusca]|uniref:FAM69 protein-kinase domain-containing protein n=1 Tax=Allacma fusca TaxID=39272 RepID=A0A8J2P4W9_9HEXA|nr:unnamed protein product [Allacma fusca]